MTVQPPLSLHDLDFAEKSQYYDEDMFKSHPSWYCVCTISTFSVLVYKTEVSPTLLWDMIKLNVCEKSLKFAAEKKCKTCNKQATLENTNLSIVEGAGILELRTTM